MDSLKLNEWFFFQGKNFSLKLVTGPAKSKTFSGPFFTFESVD
ncbi:hypothetical protein HMPREF0345_2455 [Enterococcus faecalis ATCC 29200]|uniref:Uncharacterized protein n=1 Tax=Enterococcus faecalis RP2S-4 TaxID=1244145 RepID=A0ABC9TLT0_ENTFL|nr:hypothetical protein OG1RF_11039 [Enterococcus faecalis OG1RF]EEN70677.1 hypothetical protein HMPREF0345_2455 [Enterococcus faecalis ATCC 29200]EEN74813.1 hypothetical protein HMPREF0349_1270 [Enterococcus faecalis TX1322]EFM67015.1 hypothetical protein HMPREF9509_01557 [Enterococcus faecalis TX0411]EFM73422.1 hypothetical protein HMPREF9515_01401 [Enterococcus faecalis TX0860]EFM75048.1 hypothetical protein HMPREF9521_03201 [Enterococcus faecalis TX2134]EFM78994.1 hypothetical protein HMP